MSLIFCSYEEKDILKQIEVGDIFSNAFLMYEML